MATQAKRPRPNKNKDGQPKQPVPTMSHNISIEPGKPTPPPEPPPVPGAPAPGAVNPMTHPMHPQMQSQLGTAPSPQPGSAPAGPTAAPQDMRQVRENIQFKDMQPPAQNQMEQQQGIDPYAPLKMVQQGVQGAIQQGPSTGPMPNMLAGPYVPPGVEGFPDDYAHLATLMQQGFAPGASHQEHELAMNANALHRSKVGAAMAQAQNGTGDPQIAPPAPAPAPMGAPPAGPPTVGLAAGVPGAPPSPPGLASSLGAPGGASPGGPPQAPGAPGGIPPELIAALLAQHKRPGAMR